jgi:hypothetical protein
MSVSYVSSPNSRVMGDFLAPQGMPSRRGRQIVQVKLGIKGQKAVRDIRIQGTKIPCYGIDFLLIHIAGDQKGAGYQKGGGRPLECPLAQGLEVF